jgi:hypothetical protein
MDIGVNGLERGGDGRGREGRGNDGLECEDVDWGDVDRGMWIGGCGLGDGACRRMEGEE